MKANRMKWAIPRRTPEDIVAPISRVDEEEANYGNFNAALGDPQEGYVAVASNPRTRERQRDLEDVEEAERRLNDPTDKLKPFKRSC